MEKIFEVHAAPDWQSRDFVDDWNGAVAFVERAGNGRIVTFIKGFDGRARSCAMAVYENGAWRGVDISR